MVELKRAGNHGGILPSLRVTAGARDLFARPSIETRAGRASLSAN
jgi:hypothetical protein